MRYYTLKEFADKVGFHRETIRQLAARGQCGRKILGRWRFNDNDIEALEEWPSRKGAELGTLTSKSVANEYEKLLARATGS